MMLFTTTSRQSICKFVVHLVYSLFRKQSKSCWFSVCKPMSITTRFGISLQFDGPSQIYSLLCTNLPQKFNILGLSFLNCVKCICLVHHYSFASCMSLFCNWTIMELKFFQTHDLFVKMWARQLYNLTAGVSSLVRRNQFVGLPNITGMVKWKVQNVYM